MQVSLGRKGDYAVRAVLYLARRHGAGLSKGRVIAAEMEIPRNYLPQILRQFVHAGLLSATPGPTGGYALAREPGEISLLEVIEIAEGPVDRARCALRGGACSTEDACSLHEPWAAAQSKLAEALGAVTFAELAR